MAICEPRRSPVPPTMAFVLSPMLLSSCRELPRGDGWVLEPKWDGYRLVARTGVGIWTRHETPLAGRLPELEAALAELPAGTVLDDELVALRERDGQVVQDFAALGALWRRRPLEG